MTYEYRCEECGDIEVIHSIKLDRKEQRCPNCERLLKPLISRNVGLVVKGKAPWEYRDIQKVVNTGFVKDEATITDKREGSKTFGKSVKVKDLR